MNNLIFQKEKLLKDKRKIARSYNLLIYFIHNISFKIFINKFDEMNDRS